MSVIKWRESYNTGIENFDMEHHKIVELIDIMFTAIRDKSDKKVVENVCDDLLSYTVYHFDNEEQAMKAVNYPEIEEHAAEHARLKSEAAKFHTIIINNFPEGTVEFYHFLREWLVNHIQDCDKKYTPFLKNI